VVVLQAPMTPLKSKVRTCTQMTVRGREWSPREWSRWEASDIDGQTQEGETSGKKTNQATQRCFAAH
jgi:hypothetical protein